VNLQEAYYNLKFENAFLNAKGDAFQTFFEKLMSLAYKADFMPCRPWGRQGDQKNDGYLKSERMLFQVYAPDEMTAAKAKAKIKEDFDGAKKHWRKYFDKWIFVHNAVKGLPPDVLKTLLDLAKADKQITVTHWCLQEFRDVFRRITPDDLCAWFGSAPTPETIVGFKDLKVIFDHLARQTTITNLQVKDVPPGKIEANDLSDSVAVLLKHGMAKAPLVEQFFEKWHDPYLGERVAHSFRSKYQSLRADLRPNEIFNELMTWAGGSDRGTPEHELAVYTVMAYYFERCDIFEAPRGEA